MTSSIISILAWPGCFLTGLDYLLRLDEPRDIHMLSHARREISNGAIRIISGQGATISGNEREECDGEGRRDRLPSVPLSSWRGAPVLGIGLSRAVATREWRNARSTSWVTTGSSSSGNLLREDDD